jgi:hypothetical protein
MNVCVFVEGSSDKLCMETLLKPLIERKEGEGVGISFFEAPKGDKKKSVLGKVPLKAVNILRNDHTAIVVAMPDLYPRNKAFPHETFEELKEGILRIFRGALQEKTGTLDQRIVERFTVFCFKHDLEALILACEDSLASRLGTRTLRRTWRLPVEDQNHDHPPKRVVQELFDSHGDAYDQTVDGPMILRGEEYQNLADRCPQCFQPFVRFLESCHP